MATADRRAEVSPPSRESLEWLLRETKARSIVGLRPLTGGGGHGNHLVSARMPEGSVRRFVLRRWTRPGWEAEDPEFTPTREALTLQRLERAGHDGHPIVVAPRLVALDPLGHDSGVPALVETFLRGHPMVRPRDLDAFVRGLAEALATIHAVPPDPALDASIRYRRFYDPAQIRTPMWARSASVWEAAIDLAGGPPSIGASGFIHRDYHPGNVLWRHGTASRPKVSGVVDWTSASHGPFAVDIGHLRFNLAASNGPEAADAFLGAARSVGLDVDDWPEWDIRATLDVLPEISGAREPKAELVRIERHVARALGELGIQARGRRGHRALPAGRLPASGPRPA
jgi:aminoglycoside phosphotransferase (APT) family kinase protein